MRSHNRCERCQSLIKLHVHHKVYRNNLSETILDNLIVLCCVCHKEEHGLKIYKNDYYKSSVGYKEYLARGGKKHKSKMKWLSKNEWKKRLIKNN